MNGTAAALLAIGVVVVLGAVAAVLIVRTVRRNMRRDRRVLAFARQAGWSIVPVQGQSPRWLAELPQRGAKHLVVLLHGQHSGRPVSAGQVFSTYVNAGGATSREHTTVVVVHLRDRHPPAQGARDAPFPWLVLDHDLVSWTPGQLEPTVFLPVADALCRFADQFDAPGGRP